MKTPTPGRTYFKISLDEVVSLLSSEARPIVRPMDNEMAELFETWLAGRYRMPYQTDEALRFMVTCPTVQLRFGELAGMIRFTVALKFSYGKEDFVVPSVSMRKEGRFSPPPTEVHLRRIPPEEGFPFFIDGRLLRRELCATREEVDDLYRELSAKTSNDTTPLQFLGLLTALLDGGSPDGSAHVLLERLTLEMSKRLGSSAFGGRCYPVAIVMDADRAKTTWHLQRDIQVLIQKPDDIKRRSILWTYLSRTPAREQEKTVLGLFREPGLTPSQLEAARRFLGSPLSAVQGPPGTGKTTLVLHLSAHLLVSRIAAYAASGAMPEDLTVIASTNNRAVDNVIDELMLKEADGELPLALRAGSRRVCVDVLAPRLYAVKAWLTAALQEGTREEKEKRLTETTRRFTETMTALNDLLAPERQRQKALAKQVQLRKELEKLSRTLDRKTLACTASLQTIVQTQRLVQRLEHRLEGLSGRCEGRPTKQRLSTIRYYFGTKIEKLLKTASAPLGAVGLDAVIFKKPKKGNRGNKGNKGFEGELESWEDAAETALNQTCDLLIRLESLRVHQKKQQQRESIEQKLAVLEIPDKMPQDETALNTLRASLFRQAMAVRGAWAACHAESLLSAVKSACRAAEDQASLRRFCRTQGEAFRRLKALFPVWGTTLLSMGNVFDDERGTIDRAVIDEAGQCHPAYAVSALMRCNRALILGDVHQLTPIFGLVAQDERPIFEKVFGDRQTDVTDYRVFDRSYTSVQMLAEKATDRLICLNDHFRCQKDIIDISNRLCGYNLTVHTPRRTRADRLPMLDRPVQFIHIDGEQERIGGSWWNMAEAQTAIHFIDMMLNAGISMNDIALITPYRGQLFNLRRVIASKDIPIEASAELLSDPDPHTPLDPNGLAIGTVHRFQGGERSIVIFSTVLTSPRSLSFLNERVNLINVAVSRARDHLLIIGHEPTLAQGRLSRLLLASNHKDRLV